MKRSVTFLCLLGLSLSSSVFAEDSGKGVSSQSTKRSNMTAEQRESMAKAHEKAAECLRSGQSADECHEGMRMACKNELGDQCPMRGHEKGMGMKQGVPLQKKGASK